MLTLGKGISGLRDLLERRVLGRDLVLGSCVSDNGVLQLTSGIVFLSIRARGALYSRCGLSVYGDIIVTGKVTSCSVGVDGDMEGGVEGSFNFLRGSEVVLCSNHLRRKGKISSLVKTFLVLLGGVPTYHLIVTKDKSFGQCFRLMEFYSQVAFMNGLGRGRLCGVCRVTSIKMLLSFARRYDCAVVRVLVFNLPVVNAATPNLSRVFRSNVRNVGVGVEGGESKSFFCGGDRVMRTFLSFFSGSRINVVSQGYETRCREVCDLGAVSSEVTLLLGTL